MTIPEIRPPEDVDALLADLDEPRRPAARTAPGTWRHRKKDGTLIDVEITAGRVRFEGRPAALVLAHDVHRAGCEPRGAAAPGAEDGGDRPARRRRRARLQQPADGRSSATASCCSELRPRPTSARDVLDEITQAGERARRPDAPAARVQPAAGARSRACSTSTTSWPTWRRCCGGSSARTSSSCVRLDPDLGRVEADPGQIEQVIMNLAVNARDAMPHGRQADDRDRERRARRGATRAQHVDGDSRAATCMLAVSDTGVGMDAETSRRASSSRSSPPRSRARAPASGSRPCYGIVKQSGGSIWVYSEPGSGTTFKIYLPAAVAARADAATTAPWLRPTRGSETILLVEDDASVRNLVRLMLESKGYRVIPVAGASEAERLCTDEVDLLLTDVVMPEVNGRELAERLAPSAPGDEDPLHVRLHGRRRLPPRGDQPERRVHREAVHGPHARAQGP